MNAIQGQRIRHRLLVHHGTLLLLSAVSITALYATRPYSDFFARASFATAYPALVLLTLSLLIGPWNTLRNRPNPVSIDLRRDIGIWAGLLSIVHSAIGQCVHLRGRPWLYYVYEHRQSHIFPLRHDVFGFSNYTGAASTLLVIALLATSNDWSLRVLGTPKWKQLQRWNYAAFALAAAHSIGYQISQNGNTYFHLTVRLCIAITLGLQLAGFLRRRRGDGRGSGQAANESLSPKSQPR